MEGASSVCPTHTAVHKVRKQSDSHLMTPKWSSSAAHNKSFTFILMVPFRLHRSSIANCSKRKSYRPHQGSGCLREI